MSPNKLTPGYNLMWESSRMMLPEHREQLLEEKRKTKEFQMPILDDNQLEEINRLILQSLEQNQTITITYAELYGPAEFSGWIQKVDTHKEWLKISNEEDTLTLSFKRILQVGG